ncbi:MAG: AbrB/MazE/SpoVT family DNA-binding domain-containing protein [Campylobacteraceae bacterium]|jgi:antitoxin component of MazEF toxin-antitoxin module|nr:AbrB/MazE/SpoVT family DNA-binding domain-containing protein [Campylobacteraceae bacterium]
MITVRLASWGNSTALRLPKKLLKQLGLKENSTVSIDITKNQELIIKPINRHKTLAERFKNRSGTCEGELVDWDKPVGGEVW